MGILSLLFGKKSETDYKELINSGAIIVDVRTPSEFKSGNIKGSVNIPLDSLKNKINTLKNKKVITICQSGMRSRVAKQILNSAQIECYNGGSWSSLQRKIN
ncbi:MAG: rhodanese-like domain-containing protein [Flavobacteriales bacterium]|nr:rhodanese-like domain-containing protein [Flavobacteriales bacterium]